MSHASDVWGSNVSGVCGSNVPHQALRVVGLPSSFCPGNSDLWMRISRRCHVDLRHMRFDKKDCFVNHFLELVPAAGRACSKDALHA